MIINNYFNRSVLEKGEIESLEVAGLVIDKKRLTFDLANTLKFPIDEKRMDHFTITNNSSSEISFKIYAPTNPYKVACSIFSY